MITDMHLELSTELAPPPEPKRRDKKWRRHPRPGALTKRGPRRPYRRLPEDKLGARIQKLTDRLEKAKQQHQDTLALLTKYLHERHYRLHETLEQGGGAPDAPELPPPVDAGQNMPNLPELVVPG